MYSEIVSNQRKYFNEHETFSYSYRMKKLNELKEEILIKEKAIKEALFLDLGKSGAESYMTEIAPVVKEINYLMKNLKKLMKPKKVKTPLELFPAKSYIVPEPLGVVLVISPWNYPFLLAFNPLIGALSAGNTVVVKPSEFAINTQNIIIEILNNVFESNYVYVVTGGVSETTSLLKEKFDHIFFTGSTDVGRIIMESASKHLTPVTLELGGKSPVFIFKDANIKLATRRITFGKLINSGQTCIAPDYLLITKEMYQEFVDEFKYNVLRFYGTKPLENKDYPKIISNKHHSRLLELIKDEDIIYGGNYSKDKIEPTLVLVKDLNSNIMKEEIFGPILPVIIYNESSDLFEHIKEMDKPLATYVFTNDIGIQEEFMKKFSTGGLVFNDTLMHFANNNLPFGGVGNSGMGKYHGDSSFKIFTHYKSVLNRKTWLDLKVRYHPINEKKEKTIKKIMK